MDHDETTPSSRKRAQPLSDHDVPSPTPAKRRKLDDTNDESPSTTPKTLSAIASAITGIWGHNRSPQKASHGQPHGASPNPLSASLNTPPKPRPAIKMAALKGTRWDNGETGRSTVPKKTTPRKTTPKKIPSARGSAAKQKPAGSGNVTDENRTPGSAKGLDGELQQNGTPIHESPSHPQPQPWPTGNMANRYRESSDELAAGTASDAFPGTPSGRKLFPASRPAGSVAAVPAPKGILTPTKKRGPKPQKSVTFNGPTNGDLLFQDLPNGTTPKKPKSPKKSKKAVEEDADEIRCGICSKPHSKPPNEIILCDNCDFAAHQECYGVPEIPIGDWLCKPCAQEDILKVTKVPGIDTTTAPAVAVTAAEVPGIPNLDQHLRGLQRVLLDRCAGRRSIRISGQQDAYDKAHQLVEQTVVAGEGNSMLLIGARGSGKTTLVENIVRDLSQEHRHEFHVVRLNGFIHTDDKLALKEIWRQLGKEMDVEDDLLHRTNYADTMASLLALLSHPSEIMGADEGVTSQSVIFVIDEFDMFATHPRQTLLYNLFDIAQSRKAPIAVLGCTSRLDVVEMLEKRVKSRFSHRYVYLSLPRTLLAFWHICRQGLMVDEADAVKEGVNTSLEGYDEFQKYWAHRIEEIYKQRSFQDLLQYHYYTTKSAAAFFTEWILPLSSLSSSDLRLDIPSSGAESTSLAPPDSRLQLLSTLSELDLSLLIAAARLDIVAHTDTVNFAMAYDEYSSLVGKQRVQSAASGMLAVGGGARVWSRGVAGIAWERLIALGLLVPAGIGGGKTAGHGGLDAKMWKVDVALEEIPTAVKLNNVLAKWCKEI